MIKGKHDSTIEMRGFGEWPAVSSAIIRFNCGDIYSLIDYNFRVFGWARDERLCNRGIETMDIIAMVNAFISNYIFICGLVSSF